VTEGNSEDYRVQKQGSRDLEINNRVAPDKISSRQDRSWRLHLTRSGGLERSDLARLQPSGKTAVREEGQKYLI
jgi:hypothetical protein